MGRKFQQVNETEEIPLEQRAAPLAPLCGYPCGLCDWRNLLTQTYDRDLIRAQSCHDRLCQHRTVVCRILFIGNDRNSSRFITFPYRLGSVKSCRSVSEDNIIFFCIIQNGAFFCFNFYKILFSDSAHRTYLDRRIENFSADKTFHKRSGAFFLRLYRFFVLHDEIGRASCRERV